MGASYFRDAAGFAIETLFGLYVLIVMLRFLLQIMRADFYNPVSQFIVTATQPPLRFLRRMIPSAGGIDTSSIVLMLALQAVELWLIYAVAGHGTPALPGLLLLSIAELLRLAINVFLFSILIQVVISWINPGLYNPITSILHSLNEPLLRPVRGVVPPISGLDLSPLVVLVGLQLTSKLLVAPIGDVATRLL